MTERYRYTETDLWRGEPHHYHYSRFEGIGLLTAYRDDRSRALGRLMQKIDVENDTRSDPIEGAAALPPPFHDAFDRPVFTVKELRLATEWVSRGGDILNAELTQVVDALTRKFEVSKRLRARYGTNLRPETAESAPLAAYAFLGGLLAARKSNEDLLWRLNALLKVNDLLISTDIEALSTDAATAMAYAVREEAAMVSRLTREKGIRVE